ncbi:MULTISPECIES: hypothetical protein [unclassified Exiguobacterium]|uniref:hypothetical protein n=1 Tax=unclassified Exiguobacterium TaxID=2644629 RepID=UPI001038D87E|nr:MULTISPECIES: hypothetical protein [unclassified Exiguobacterium]TCI39227.1 hypothetical protein EVJ29_00890 [Exiguobacterium sp. SH4S7]TCI62984.1 hypothetical protein EVJ21_05575 [Exiguobacterium sp. SH0S2]
MSEFQFMTSDRPLKEVENPYIEFLSINEAIKKGVVLPEMLTDDEDLDRDEKILMHVEAEEQLDEIEVKRELYYAEENVEAYSKKPHVAELRWRYTETRAQQLVDYITDHLKTADEVEIWKVWVDEQTEPSVRSITLDELTIDELRFLGDVGFERPECLHVVKS